jgi:hypothetical protein
MPAAKLFGEPSRLIQMYSIANVCFCFEIAKKSGNFFEVSAIGLNLK